MATPSGQFVIPEPFNGESKWEEWMYYFESIADVNEWDGAKKLKWLKMRLTGRDTDGFSAPARRCQEWIWCSKGDWHKDLSQRVAKDSIKQSYRPIGSAKQRDELMLPTIRASWLTKAYPELQVEARERLAIDQYLWQLEHPQMAFSFRQKKPERLDDVVSATLEMEIYILGGTSGRAVSLSCQARRRNPCCSCNCNWQTY